ncbi:MAG: hypothetical protein PHF31_03010 [Methylobacter sp.]|nr:hypothetical protein [Methylobacter sp.]
MSSCCSSSSSKTTSQHCAQCGTACKSVKIRTVYHQVRFPENQGITSDNYFFCPSKECSTGYFSKAGIIIPSQQLRSHQEIQEDKLCYCFDIYAADYLNALRANTAELIKDFVIERTISGDCACEIRNPAGQCCLAKFKHLDKEYSSKSSVN